MKCDSCKLTRHGVCYDLEHSPFFSTWSSFIFFFSSMKHKESFDSKINVRIPWLNDSLSRRFKMKVDVDVLAVFQLYNQVETRGFYVEKYYFYDKDGNFIEGGKVDKWRAAEQVVFDGLQVSWRGSTEREETTTDV